MLQQEKRKLCRADLESVAQKVAAKAKEKSKEINSRLQAKMDAFRNQAPSHRFSKLLAQPKERYTVCQSAFQTHSHHVVDDDVKQPEQSLEQMRQQQQNTYIAGFVHPIPEAQSSSCPTKTVEFHSQQESPVHDTRREARVAPGAWADWDKDVQFRQIRQTGATGSELCPWWIEARDGWAFCFVCNRYVTSDHITSNAHIDRVKSWEEDKHFQEEEPNAEAQAVWDDWLQENPFSGMAQDANSTAAAASAPSSLPQRSGAILYATPIGGPDPAWGDSTYFQFSQEKGWWWCKLCKQWSDDNHVKGKKHLNKVDHLVQHAQARENRVACTAREAQADHFDADVEQANLSAQDIAFDPWGPNWKKKMRRTQKRANQVPPPWRKEWSDIHQRSYYWNPDTGETTWEIPKRRPNPAIKGLRSSNNDGNGGYVSSASSNQVPPPWIKEWSEKHSTYFYWNPETLCKTWDIPTAEQHPYKKSFWS